MEVDHVLRSLGHHVITAVEQCGVEVASYLTDLSNWPQPIFPDVTDCNRLELVPPYFNISDNFWSCDNQMDEGELEN